MSLQVFCSSILARSCMIVGPVAVSAQTQCSPTAPSTARSDALLTSSDLADRPQPSSLQMMLTLHQLYASPSTPRAIVSPVNASCCDAQRSSN